MTIKTILFDLGGVVVPEKAVEIGNSLADLIGISYNEFSELIKPYKPSLTSGKIKLIDAYSRIIESLGKNISPEDILRKHIEEYGRTSTERDPDMIGLINKLKLEYRVVCLTNTEIEIAEFNKARGLFNYFEEVYISTELKLKKPDRKIYLKVLEELNCSPREVLFIDNDQSYIDGAKSVGINCIRFENYEQLIKKLDEHKIKF